jgi:superfamily I DNA/RNA helicase
MNREILMKLNTLFPLPRFNERIEEKGLAEISKTFCLFVSMGLSQNSQTLKSKAERMTEENKYRYELLYRLESIWRRLDLICIQIQSIDFDIVDGVEITDAMLLRTYNHFSALKSNGDKVVGLLRKLGKSENGGVESLCDQIDLAADELEKVIKI